MIIDCEVYREPKPMAGKVFDLPGLETLAREAGIDRSIVMPAVAIRPKNKELAQDLAANPTWGKMFVGCAWINPQLGDEAVNELEVSVKEWGFRGLKLMPTHHAFRSISKVPYPLMKKAEELGIAVTIHSGTFFSHPLEIALLAEAFPKVPVIMDHMGYRYYVGEAIAAAVRTPNIYLATTSVSEPHWIRQAVQEIGAERVLFGSNAPHTWPVTQVLVIRQAELKPEDECKVLGENAARVFGL